MEFIDAEDQDDNEDGKNLFHKHFDKFNIHNISFYGHAPTVD